MTEHQKIVLYEERKGKNIVLHKYNHALYCHALIILYYMVVYKIFVLRFIFMCNSNSSIKKLYNCILNLIM